MLFTPSPLRYPGGKFKMYSQIEKIIIDSNLNGCTYIEPFAGGSAVALGLLFKKVVSRIAINDLDEGVYAFWHSIINNHEAFIKLIVDTPITIEERKKQKNILTSSKDLLTLGFSFFYLNRTNRSGIISGGPIGGANQDSPYKIDCRFNKSRLIDRIKKIADYKDKIDVYNLDGEDFIRKIPGLYGKQSFILIDPPYYVKGRELYLNAFSHEDHIRLNRCIIENLSEIPFIVTYDNVKNINEIYHGFSRKCFSLNYSIGNTKFGKEVMFFSPNLVCVETE